MNHKQKLPTYRHDFENDLRFIFRESKHYIFHYFKNSEAEKDIETIIRTQESSYAKILNFLKVKEPNKRIEYYFYPDKQIKTQLMGDDWYAQSIYEEFRIHALYTNSIKPIGPHEDTHLLSLPWGLSVGFLNEGLAEFMVGNAWDGCSHADYVREGYKQKIYPEISVFMRHEAWLETNDSHAIYFYSLVGAFVSFLIKKFGKKRFEEFYKTSDRKNSAKRNSDIFVNTYGIDITAMEHLFISDIR